MKVPNVPRDPSKGTHSVPLERVIYIERSDFREVYQLDHGLWSNWLRLGRAVMWLHVRIITVSDLPPRLQRMVIGASHPTSQSVSNMQATSSLYRKLSR